MTRSTLASPRSTHTSLQFSFVQEWNDPFLALFPHRDDYLWADHPAPGERPQWHTESTHPLSDRQIQQGAYLFGVRFDALTHYLLLDLDPSSRYHPWRDPLAIANLVHVLEPLGLVTYIAVKSSDRGGIHLYFPFAEAQKSWAIARAAASLLTQNGYALTPGQLELFPNPKPYSETPTLYNGHRLPLQAGSYLLNEDWQPTYSNSAEFVRRWQFAQQHNDVSQATVERILKQAQQKTNRKLRQGGQKYLNDLNIDIEAGWTAPGQTNLLLGKIANRERIFHHVIWGGEPLVGDALAQRIAQVARSLPGFEEFCGHQTDLDQKAKQWARAAEQRYYPYLNSSIRSKVQPDTTAGLSRNQQQALEARERIKAAIADLLNQGILPAQATARRNAIRIYRIGNKTLDKNRDLWHPDHLEPATEAAYHSIDPNSETESSPEPLLDKKYHSINLNKLEGLPDADAPQEQSASGSLVNEGGSGGFSTGVIQEPQGIEWVQLTLRQIRLDKQKSACEGSGPLLEGAVLRSTEPEADLLSNSEADSIRSIRIQNLQAISGEQGTPQHTHKDKLIPIAQMVSESRIEGRRMNTVTQLVEANAIVSDEPISQMASIQEKSLFFRNLTALPTLEPFSDEDLSEITAAIQVLIKLLKWTSEQASRYIAEHFSGRRRYELTKQELLQLTESLELALIGSQ